MGEIERLVIPRSVQCDISLWQVMASDPPAFGLLEFQLVPCLFVSPVSPVLTRGSAPSNFLANLCARVSRGRGVDPSELPKFFGSQTASVDK